MSSHELSPLQWGNIGPGFWDMLEKQEKEREALQRAGDQATLQAAVEEGRQRVSKCTRAETLVEALKPAFGTVKRLVIVDTQVGRCCTGLDVSHPLACNS